MSTASNVLSGPAPDGWRRPNPLVEIYQRLRWRFFPGKSGLETFAERELARIGDDEDDVAEMNGGPMWQNNRCSHVFNDGDGRAYDIDGRVFVEPNGCAFTGTGSRVYIEFPYTPSRVEIAVDGEGEPLEGPSRAELASC